MPMLDFAPTTLSVTSQVTPVNASMKCCLYGERKPSAVRSYAHDGQCR
jgi:hypothetical protein